MQYPTVGNVLVTMLEMNRNDERDDYWHMGAGTLIKSGKTDDGVLLSPGTMHCGTDGVPFCSEAWDASCPKGKKMGYRIKL